MDKPKLSTIYIGGDHASYDEREKIEKHLTCSGFTVVNLGSYNNKPANYAEYAILVANNVKNNPNSKGIVMCGSGIGVNIAANKVDGIKSALVYTNSLANYAKKNNYNVIALGARFISYKKIEKFVDVFLNNKCIDHREAVMEQYRDIDVSTKKDFDENNTSSKNTNNLSDELTIDEMHEARLIK